MSRNATPSFVSRAVAGLVLFALAAACDSPTVPNRNGPPEARRSRLEIASTTAVAPQQTTEVQAFLVTPDGARQDVTARVTWTTSDSAVLSVSSGGRVTGGAMGEATLRAMLDDLTASITVIVVPAGTFRLAGIVRAPGSTSPLWGAQVQLITASGDVLTAGTAGPGFRFYGVAGRARLRVSRRAFRLYEAEIDINDHLTHDVSLSPIDLSGTYTLTLAASSRCGLEFPEDVRIRKYTANIAQVDGSLTVTLQSPSIWPGLNVRFPGVFGETNEVLFEFRVEEWFLPGPSLEFSAFGRMTATISADGLSGFLDAGMTAIVSNEGGRGSGAVTCTAPDHRVVFSR